MQVYAEQVHLVPRRRFLAPGIQETQSQNATTILRIIRDHLGIASSSIGINLNNSVKNEDIIPTTQMHVDTQDDQWDMQGENPHIYSRYTSCSPPPLIKDNDEGTSNFNSQLQSFYDIARENSMRERLLTMIGAQREVLLQRRNELQYLQQAAADLAGPSLAARPIEEMPSPRYIASRNSPPEVQRRIPNLLIFNRRDMLDAPRISSQWSSTEALNMQNFSETVDASASDVERLQEHLARWRQRATDM